MPSEKVASFRFDRVGHLDVLARQAARWAQDHAGTISAADPEMPGIHNREADNWAPLLAIADAAGGAWPERARAAAAAGHVAGGDEASLIELLLGDIRDAFAKREANKVEPADRISSGDLVTALVAIEGRPWAELGKSRKPLTQNGLARRLRPLSIAPDSVRVDEKRTPKGYSSISSRKRSRATWGLRRAQTATAQTISMKRAQVRAFKAQHPSLLSQLKNARESAAQASVAVRRMKGV